MAEVTDPRILQMLNSGGPSAKTPQSRPAPVMGTAPPIAPNPTKGLTNNPILQAKQLGILLDQGSLAKNDLELKRLGFEIKKLQNDLTKSGLTEQQSKELARYISEREGQNYYKLAVTKGFVPNSMLNKISTGVQGITGSRDIGDWARSFDETNSAQTAETGMQLFTEGVMREMTGASGRAEEPGDIRAQYFPGAFQRTDPDLWKSLEATRQAQIDAAYKNSGLPNLPKPDKNVPVPTSSKLLPSGISSEDQQALDWANKNPRDSRSAAIKRRLGF